MAKEILNKAIKESSKDVEEIVYGVVKEYTNDLDQIMMLCRKIFNSGIPLTDLELNDLMLQLPSTLYFVGEGLEFVGIRQDISEMMKKENYNSIRSKAIGTVIDKNSEAEMKVINENINQVIYERAYKMIKGKVEMGYEMINSLKKLFDKRTRESQMPGSIK